MDSLIVLFYSVLIGSIGYAVVSKLAKSSLNALERVVFGYALGVGLTGYLLFYLSRFGVSWNSYLALLTLGVLVSVVYILRQGGAIRTVRLFEFRLSEKALLFLIGVTALYTLIQNQMRPVIGWDAWAIWLLKAKIFYIDGAVNAVSFFYSDSAYPYVLSLYSTSVYIFLGGVNDTAVLITHYVFYVLIAGLLFTLLNDKIGRFYSLVVVFLYLSTQNVIRHGGRFEAGYSDLALGLYLFCTVVLLSRLTIMLNWSGVFLLSIFIGLCGMVKNDGLPFAIMLLVVAIFKITQKRKYGLLLPLFIGLIPLIDWHLYKVILSLPIEPFPFHPRNNISYFFPIFFHMFQEFFHFRNWNMLWLIFILSTFLHCIFRKTTSFVAFFIFYQLFVYFVIFLVTSVQPPTSHVDNTINRLLLHVVPLSFYFIAVSIFTKKSQDLRFFS